MRAAPPLNALRAFEAAARHLSLTKAAHELNVTPSAISHQIHGLETLLGVELFERRARSIALTPAGDHGGHWRARGNKLGPRVARARPG